MVRWLGRFCMASLQSAAKVLWFPDCTSQVFRCRPNDFPSTWSLSYARYSLGALTSVISPPWTVNATVLWAAFVYGLVQASLPLTRKRQTLLIWFFKRSSSVIDWKSCLRVTYFQSFVGLDALLDLRLLWQRDPSLLQYLSSNSRFSGAAWYTHPWFQASYSTTSSLYCCLTIYLIWAGTV